MEIIIEGIMGISYLAILANKPIAFIFLIMYFIHNVRMYGISTFTKFQVLNPRSSWVIEVYTRKTMGLSTQIEKSTKAHNYPNNCFPGINSSLRVPDILMNTLIRLVWSQMALEFPTRLFVGKIYARV